MRSDVTLICKKCGHEIKEEIYVPEPYYAAERHSDSDVQSEEDLVCDGCGEVYVLDIMNSMGGLFIYIDGKEDENLSYSHPYFEEENEDTDWYIETPYSEFYDFAKYSLREVESLLSTNWHDPSQEAVAHRMLFAQCITILETYLSDTFKSLVLKNNNNTLALLEFDKDIQSEKFTLHDFASDPDLIKKKINAHLSGLMYHNIAKISTLYNGVLQIKFDFGGPENRKKLFKAIDYRHDCVHRNGKDKDGNALAFIDEQFVSETLNIVETLIDNIEDKVSSAGNEDGLRESDEV